MADKDQEAFVKRQAAIKRAHDTRKAAQKAKEEDSDSKSGKK